MSTETKSKRWSVTGTVTAGTYIGIVEAATKEEAEEKALRNASVSVCHQCASDISDPEVTEVFAEPAEPSDGE